MHRLQFRSIASAGFIINGIALFSSWEEKNKAAQLDDETGGYAPGYHSMLYGPKARRRLANHYVLVSIPSDVSRCHCASSEAAVSLREYVANS
jgi:hypothetical protein